MAIIDSLGGALALQGQPDTAGAAGLAQENIRYGRAEEERKRREQAKKDQEASDKYQNIINNLKVEGYDPIYNEEIKRQAGEVIGILNEGYKKNKYADPYTNPEFVKKLQDFQIFSDEAKQATKALSEDYGLSASGKVKLKQTLAEALRNNDYQAYQKALGGQKHYRRGLGVEPVEEQFNYLSFKGKVNNAFNPSEKTTEIKDPATGLFRTEINQYYTNPVGAAAEALASDPKAVEFFKEQYNSLPVSKQKIYSDKAQSQGGSGNAYLEYAATRLFDNTGLKTKSTIQEPNGSGSGDQYAEFSGEGEVLIKPILLDEMIKGKKLFGKVEKFVPLKQDKVHRMTDPYGNILDVSNVRKIFYDDGTIGYEGKIIEESRVKRRVKDEFGIIKETEELLPQYASVVFSYDKNKQVEFGEKGFSQKETNTNEEKPKESKQESAKKKKLSGF